MSNANLQVKTPQDHKTVRRALIKVMMQLRGITYKDLSEYCGVGISMVNKVVLGEKRSKPVEEKLNRYFGVELF